jgi:hypothetical protein
MQPTRRHLIQLAALPALLRAQDHHQHSAAPPDPELLRNYQPAFFAAGDFEALQSFTEILIPTDDTPGAREARCAHYIDFLLQASAPDVQKQWRAALDSLRSGGFHKATPAGRAELIEAMSHPQHELFPVFQRIKEQTAFAYYTSRVGLIDNLDYRGNSYNATFPACDHPEHRHI